MKKFNASQFGAISAASAEYGKGGFTLVKGPPGVFLLLFVLYTFWIFALDITMNSVCNT